MPCRPDYRGKDQKPPAPGFNLNRRQATENRFCHLRLRFHGPHRQEFLPRATNFFRECSAFPVVLRPRYIQDAIFGAGAPFCFFVFPFFVVVLGFSGFPPEGRERLNSLGALCLSRVPINSGPWQGGPSPQNFLNSAGGGARPMHPVSPIFIFGGNFLFLWGTDL